MLPSNILFNCWKHHAGFLREQINNSLPLEEWPAKLRVMGAELMDLYTGSLPPNDIAAGILDELSKQDLDTLETYRPWIEEGGGYRVTALEADGSYWTLRLGDEKGRFIHIHPGRRTPHTVRVRANVLKTAVMVLAYVNEHGGDSMETALVNQVRTQYLNLSPMREVLADEGLGPILRLLQPT